MPDEQFYFIEKVSHRYQASLKKFFPESAIYHKTIQIWELIKKGLAFLGEAILKSRRNGLATANSDSGLQSPFSFSTKVSHN